MKIYILIKEGWGCCTPPTPVGAVDSEEVARAWAAKDRAMRDYDEVELNVLPT